MTYYYSNRNREAEELKKTNNIKTIIILVLAGMVIGMGITTWIRERELDNMEWFEERIQCLEEAPRYYNSWCNDNNVLIHD